MNIRKVTVVGNSIGVTLPAEVARAFGLERAREGTRWQRSHDGWRAAGGALSLAPRAVGRRARLAEKQA